MGCFWGFSISVLSGIAYISAFVFLHGPEGAYLFEFFLVTFWILAAACGLVYLILVSLDYFRKKNQNSN
jgi:hypothetical protein